MLKAAVVAFSFYSTRGLSQGDERWGILALAAAVTDGQDGWLLWFGLLCTNTG